MPTRPLLPSLFIAGFIASAPLSWAQTGNNQVEVQQNLNHDTSPPARDIIAPPSDFQAQHQKPIGRANQQFASNQGDPVIQSSTLPRVAPTAGLNFDGVGVGFTGPNGTFTPNSAPPDPNGVVGATQYVQWVNTSFAVFDKATGAVLMGPTAGNALWRGFGGGCETNNDGDPIVQYDKAAGRWVFTQFSVTTTPFLQCVAVSTTSDATGTYNRYSFSFGNVQFPDYPKISVWPDAYYITFNIFNNGTTFAGAKACAYDRAKMLAGAAATQVCFQQSTAVDSLLPADLDGSTPPPAGSPNLLLNFGTNSLNLFKFHVDFNTPANSTFTGPAAIAVAPFSAACGGATCIPQPGTTQQLDSLADRLMYRLAYRNFGDHEVLVANHSVTAGSSVGVRWYEIRNPSGTPTIFQQGTYAPDSTFRWMGSIGMDRAGDIAVGYSASSSSVSPSVRLTGRTPNDPLGTLQAEAIIQAGGGSQTGRLNRWGDYSAITIDPVDDCTFWYTNEYLKASGSFNWSTRIASFKFPSCGAGPDFSLSASPASQTVVQGAGTSYTVTVTPSGGFTGTVTFSAGGLPAGASATFNPASVTTSGNTTMSVTTSSTTPAGTFTLTVTGTSGTLSHTTTVTLVVNPPPKPDFTISATPASQTVVRGASTTYTATVTPTSGFTGTVTFSATGLPAGAAASFSPTSVNGSGSSTMTVTTAGTTPTGTVTLTITGSSGTLTHSTKVSLVVRRH